MAQFAHVQVLSSYWMPFALLGLHRFIETPRWRYLGLFAVSWYFQALACGYYLFYLSVLIGLWLLWFARRTDPLGRFRTADDRLGDCHARIPARRAGLSQILSARTACAAGRMRFRRSAPTSPACCRRPGICALWGWLNVVDRPESSLFPGAALILVIVLGVVLAWTAAAHGHLRRLRATRLLLAGALVFGIVAATPIWLGPWRLDVFGIRLLSVRTPQKPFSVAVLLAVVAFALHPSIRAGWARRSALAFYTLAAGPMWVFSLGPAPTLMNKPLLYKAPYAWLMLVPGVEGVRVPARFWVLATLCLAVAGALALGYIVERWPTFRRPLVAMVAVLLLVEAWPAPLPLLEPPAWRPSNTSAVSRLELPTGSIPDLFALYRATQHRRPVANGYSGYFAPHYGALQELLGRKNPAVLGQLASFGELEVVVNHDRDGEREWRTFLSAQPNVQLVSEEKDYTVYRVPQNAERLRIPQFSTSPLSIAGIRASTAEDRVSRMTDGNLITRWDTAGPQDPTNVVTVDLGAPKQVEGIETQIGGYLADFPRRLSVDVSEDGLSWSTAWEGETALMTYVAALEMPRTVPLRIPLANRRAQYIRMRQTGADRTCYWTIAELKVFGS